MSTKNEMELSNFNEIPEKENFRVQVDMDKFNELMCKMEDAENVIMDFFPTAEEIERMDENPKKYLPFVIYMLSQNREMRESEIGAEEAKFRKRSEDMLQEFIDRHIEQI